MNNKNKQILWRLANIFSAGCGTPKIEAIAEMGRNKYYAEQNKEMWNLFNELDKTNLPEKEVRELEKELKIEKETKDGEVYDICIRLLKYC